MVWFDCVSADGLVWLCVRTCRDLIVYVHKMWFDCRCRRCGLLNRLCHATTWPPEVLTCDQASSSSVICLWFHGWQQWFWIFVNTRPKPPYGRQGLAESWSKDIVRRVHFGGFKRDILALLSPPGDLGIGLVWHNLSPPDWTGLQLFGPTVEILFKMN